jgi:uncharacterized membrane protein
MPFEVTQVDTIVLFSALLVATLFPSRFTFVIFLPILFYFKHSIQVQRVASAQAAATAEINRNSQTMQFFEMCAALISALAR